MYNKTSKEKLHNQRNIPMSWVASCLVLTQTRYWVTLSSPKVQLHCSSVDILPPRSEKTATKIKPGLAMWPERSEIAHGRPTTPAAPNYSFCKLTTLISKFTSHKNAVINFITLSAYWLSLLFCKVLSPI